MVSSSQIREQLAAYLDRRIDLRTFEDWLIQSTWNIHLSRSVAAETVAYSIEEALSEYSSDHISEKQLRVELGALVYADNHVVSGMIGNVTLDPILNLWPPAPVLQLVPSGRP